MLRQDIEIKIVIIKILMLRLVLKEENRCQDTHESGHVSPDSSEQKECTKKWKKAKIKSLKWLKV